MLLRPRSNPKDALLQILVLFVDTESISKKYKLTAKAGKDLLAYSTGDMDPKMVVLDNKMKGLATERQKKGRFLKLASWSLYQVYYEKPSRTDRPTHRRDREIIPRTSGPNHACPTRSSRD